MRSTFLILMIALPMSSQAGQGGSAIEVARMCGKLVHYEAIPTGNATTFREKTRTPSHISGRIYRAGEGGKCCEALPVVGATQTDRSGLLEFEKLTTGQYWVVFPVDGRDYKFLTRFVQKKQTDQKCSDFRYAAGDDGTTSIGVEITVD
jgi:hypothetical protein